MHHRDDSQCRLSDTEVMTVTLVAVLYYGGNFVDEGDILSEHVYIPTMLSRGRFNRRLHRVKELFLTLFALIGEPYKALSSK